uniref:F-box-like family protein n=1 Tax=Pithovirus LCPAC401 TaxID=2506595 RepID=A0A481ZA24_9VIRU|nr:MAG: uncharacterized protein LCPAC401_03960 [Pithovirus LCPAC401]
MDRISSNSLQTIFTYLDVGEISRKCLINHLFNRICNLEALYKTKLSENYSITEKGDESWRSKAKEVYLESILFWNNVDSYINFYMRYNSDVENSSKKFEKRLSDHALREKKEFFVIELIFKVFLNNYHSESSFESGYFCRNFVSTFKKIEFLFPEKKISIKWILNFVDKDEDLYSKFLWRIRLIVTIYLNYHYMFIDDEDSIEWKTVLMKRWV